MFQVAELVTFWFEPSLYSITATTCSLAPGAIDGLITLSATPVAVPPLTPTSYRR